MIIQISAGQGPEECQIAVGKLFDAWKKEFIDIEQVLAKEGKQKGSYHSIIFETNQDLSALEGTVLWICKSPLRPEHKRKNWYVDISIIPEKETIVTDEEYRIETFHSGGKGGQHVNKVETGVRVTHVPTGIVVSCTEERSQYMNRQKAVKRIQAVLQAKKEEARLKQNNLAWQEHNRIVRGNPVRIYEGMEFRLKKK